VIRWNLWWAASSVFISMTLEVAVTWHHTIVLRWHSTPASWSSLADLCSCFSRCLQVFQRLLMFFWFSSCPLCRSFLVLKCCCPGSRSSQLIRLWCRQLLLLYHLPSHWNLNIFRRSCVTQPSFQFHVLAAACPSAMSQWELYHHHLHRQNHTACCPVDRSLKLCYTVQIQWVIWWLTVFEVGLGSLVCIMRHADGWCYLVGCNFSDDFCHSLWLYKCNWDGLGWVWDSRGVWAARCCMWGDVFTSVDAAACIHRKAVIAVCAPHGNYQTIRQSWTS